MNPQVIRDLKYSPLLLLKYYIHLFKELGELDERGAKFELIYLVVPFVMDDVLREKLDRSNASSTFQTAFLKMMKLKNDCFYK